MNDICICYICICRDLERTILIYSFIYRFVYCFHIFIYVHEDPCDLEIYTSIYMKKNIDLKIELISLKLNK